MGLSLEHTCWQSPFWGIHSITKTLVLASTILNSSCHAISAGTYLSTRQLVPVPGTPGQSISQTMTLPTSRPAPAWTYLAPETSMERGFHSKLGHHQTLDTQVTQPAIPGPHSSHQEDENILQVAWTVHASAYQCTKNSWPCCNRKVHTAYISST